MMMKLVLFLVAFVSLTEAAHIRWDARRQSNSEGRCPLHQCMDPRSKETAIVNWQRDVVTQEQVDLCRREVGAQQACLQSVLQNNHEEVCATCLGRLHVSLLEAINSNPVTALNKCPQPCDVNNEAYRQCYLLCWRIEDAFDEGGLQQQDIARIRQCDTCSSAIAITCPYSYFLFFNAKYPQELWIQRYLLQAKGCKADDTFTPCMLLISSMGTPQPCSNELEEVLPLVAECWKENLQKYPQCTNPDRFVQLEVNSITAKRARDCRAFQQGVEIRRQCEAN